MMVYTVTQIKQGTGFARGAAFVPASHMERVVKALAELVGTAAVMSDIEACEVGRLAMNHARAVLKAVSDE